MTTHYENAMNKLEEIGIDRNQFEYEMKTIDYDKAKPILDKMGIELTDLGNTTWGELKARYPRYGAFVEAINASFGAPLPSESDPMPVNELHLELISKVESAQTKEELVDCLDFLIDFIMEAVLVAYINEGFLDEKDKPEALKASKAAMEQFMPAFTEVCEKFAVA